MRRFALASCLVFWPLYCLAADNGVCDVANNHAKFDHQNIVLTGTVSALRETISKAGNPYTTFKIEDGNCLVDVFSWGHCTIASGDNVPVEGVFEVETDQGKYKFYNEVQATSVNGKPCK
jgi:hypothetical protein